MPETPEVELSPIARALGRVPCGLYVVTTLDAEGRPLGFVGSFVMQAGFDPPTISVAVGKDRAPLAAIRATGRFALTVLDGSSRGVMGAFFRRYEEGESPFDSLDLAPVAGDLPVMGEGLAWLSCRVSGEHATGDHVIVFGEVEDGGTLHEGDPSVHLRKDGLGY